MYYNGEMIKSILNKTKIEKIVEHYVLLKPRKNVLWGLCPFHKESAPSFTVDPAKQTYYCYGCGRGGNAISFVMGIKNYSFHQAAEELGKEVGISLPEPDYDVKEKLVRIKFFELYEEATLFYQNSLHKENGPGYAYLSERRNLTPETINKFRLGVSEDFGHTLFDHLKSLGYEEKYILASGLASSGDNCKNGKEQVFDKFWNRIMFPIADHDDKIVGFGGRVLDDGKPKYINSSESNIFIKGQTLYGLNFAKNSNRNGAILCEGNVDVISMHQAGFDNAVASLGTALTNAQARLLRQYFDGVCIAYDCDDAGIKATLRAIPILQNAGLSVTVANVSPYKDVDELINKEGATYLQERIDSAIPGDRFLVNALREQSKDAQASDSTEFDFYDHVIDLLI